jgi:hypothetical protein
MILWYGRKNVLMDHAKLILIPRVTEANDLTGIITEAGLKNLGCVNSIPARAT